LWSVLLFGPIGISIASISVTSPIDTSSTTTNGTNTWYFPPTYAGNEVRWRTTGHHDKELVSFTAETDPVTNKTICHNKYYRQKRKSQFAEDVWLYEHWFYGIKDGIALESGAYQGLAMSNTFMFQNYAGWKSIHVEGDPFNYEKLVKNRPESLNINAALCNESRQLHYLTGGADTTRGFYEFMTEKFIKDWHGGQIKQENIIPVMCHPVKDVLRQLHIKHVDIWFLDVEGAEENVLMGVDFSVVKFNAIVMECDHYHSDRNHIKQHMLKKHHYHCVHLGMTCFCKHETYIPSESPCGFSV
jgi:FkbM family methyltransferase